tara:strand:- start:9971 stop:10216 length:246 start_codon:yes stop_codon:yes gene_type:complete
MNETLLMCVGAAVFGFTLWGVLLVAYANGRDASSEDLSFGQREPLPLPTGEFAAQPVYTRVTAPEAVVSQGDNNTSLDPKD